MSVAQQLHECVRHALPDAQHLEVQDESAGHSRGSESHFRVVAVAPQFSGMSRVQRHRLIYAHLQQQLQSIHALALQLYTPDEWHARQQQAPASPACARSQS